MGNYYRWSEQQSAAMWVAPGFFTERGWREISRSSAARRLPLDGRMTKLASLYNGTDDPSVKVLLAAQSDLLNVLLEAAPLLRKHIKAVRLKIAADTDEPGMLDVYAATQLSGNDLVAAKERFYEELPSLHPRIYFLDCEP